MKAATSASAPMWTGSTVATEVSSGGSRPSRAATAISLQRYLSQLDQVEGVEPTTQYRML